MGNASLMFTETACPDPECQKKVDKILAKEKTQRQDIVKESEKREQERALRAKQSRAKAKEDKK